MGMARMPLNFIDLFLSAQVIEPPAISQIGKLFPLLKISYLQRWAAIMYFFSFYKSKIKFEKSW